MPEPAASRTLTLGFDLGSSFIKGSILDLETGRTLASASQPDQEMTIHSPQPGWAEQDPELWWSHLITLTRQLLAQAAVDPRRIAAIGISYQMHGLVCVDREQRASASSGVVVVGGGGRRGVFDRPLRAKSPVPDARPGVVEGEDVGEAGTPSGLDSEAKDGASSRCSFFASDPALPALLQEEAHALDGGRGESQALSVLRRR